jgi:hypothetical protein
MKAVKEDGLGHSFGHISTKELSILEGDIPFESQKSPLQCGQLNFIKSRP